MSSNLVRNWMTSNPITVPSSCSLQDAYWQMNNNKIRRLPVMEGSDLVGIVTLEDLRRVEPPVGIGLDIVKITDMLSRMIVRQVMTDHPRTISPNSPLVEAARMMLEFKIRALPVIEENQLVGIITESDILRAFVEQESIR